MKTFLDFKNELEEADSIQTRMRKDEQCVRTRQRLPLLERKR